jgi:hypothetical protein
MRIAQKFGIVTPEKIASLPEEEIKSVGISMKKARISKVCPKPCSPAGSISKGLPDCLTKMSPRS